MNEDKYSDEELKSIINESISEFRKLMNREPDSRKYLPDPDRFRYLHEFENSDKVRGGILIAGLNPHIGANEDEMIWRKKYEIDGIRNTSDKLLREYRYFKRFTAKIKEGDFVEKYNMDLQQIDSNVKFTDIVLIRSEGKHELMKSISGEEDRKLGKAIEIGWEHHLSKLLKLVRPKVMVCNSVDLSNFLESNFSSDGSKNQNDIISLEMDDCKIPCVLSGQVTGQRATDKWALIRMRKAIEITLRK